MTMSETCLLTKLRTVTRYVWLTMVFRAFTFAIAKTKLVFSERPTGLLVLYVISHISQAIQAFPSGAPLSACSHLMPVHIDGEMQEAASPYVLVLNTTTYSNQPIRLTVTTVGPGERDFMAFMLQARTEFGETAGYFSEAPVASRPMTCYGADDTLTHTAAFIRPSMEVLWNPPSRNMGRVAITGSIAVNKIKYWAVQSDFIKGEGKLDLSLSGRQSNTGHKATTVARALSGIAVLLYFMFTTMPTYL